MARRYRRKMALLAKIETVYGTDAVPVGAVNGILATEVTIEPMAGSEEARNLLLPWLGQQGVILTDQHVKMEFMVEIAGTGAAGTAPGYGPLLRACGFAQTINAGISVDYDPVSAAFEALSIYYNLDGVRHVILGARANVSLDMSVQKIPHFRFSVVGLKGLVDDTALPAPVLTAFMTPRVVSDANTNFALHGFAGIMEQLSIDAGNRVEPRLLVNAESAEIVDRQSSGSVTIEADTLAAKNWFSIADARTRGALLVTHGTVAGNIVEVSAPAVEIGRPSFGDSQGIVSYQLPMMLCSSIGNDELRISVK